MYKENKNNYQRVLDLSIDETKKLLEKFPEIHIYQIIYDQLQSIKDRIINSNEILTREEVFDKYNFGPIAAKNFDDSMYGNNLMFLYGLSYKYMDLPEN
jgi:hypothetical protein